MQGDVLAKAHQRLCHHFRRHVRVGEDGFADEGSAVSLRFFTSTVFVSNEIASTLPNLSPPTYRKSSPPRISVSCGGKPIPMHWCFCCPADHGHKRQTGQTGAILQQVVRRQVSQPEKLPPDRLVLTAVPVEKVGQYPAGLLFFRPVFRIVPA